MWRKGYSYRLTASDTRGAPKVGDNVPSWGKCSLNLRLILCQGRNYTFTLMSLPPKPLAQHRCSIK